MEQSQAFQVPEAAVQRCFQKKVFWKYAENLLKPHFDTGVLK